MYKRGKARPLEDSILRLGTLKASALMSSPELPSEGIRLLATTEIETGPSFAFSSRWVAVTTTWEMASPASAVSSAAAAQAADNGMPNNNDKTNARRASPERLIVLLPFCCLMTH